MPPGFHRLNAAQFTSGLADNALLIVAIALLHERGLPPWWAPLLKLFFTLAYVLLAPFVGVLADAMPKARLMAWTNALKLVGAATLLAGGHPFGVFAAFAVVGLGAAAYAPAKYGLVTELVPPARLVAANGWIEVSIVIAALLGTVGGGLLVGATFGGGAGSTLALGVVLGVYALASLLNLGIPDSGARYARAALRVGPLLREFTAAQRTLWRDPEGALSLALTTLFWGVGATLQFALLRWAADVHGLALDRAALLQALVALGVIGGAAVAGRRVALAAAPRVLPAGVLLGALVALLALLPGLAAALPLLVVIGAVGGLLVVPMNALLQHRGHRLLTAGRSIAVQNFNENLSVLGMLATYAALGAAGVPIVPMMVGFGTLIAAAVALMLLRRRRLGVRHHKDAAIGPR